MHVPGSSLVSSRQARQASWRALREYFAYHGVWSIGVRVMRLWSLRTKMLLLVSVLAVPLVPLTVREIQANNAEVDRLARRIAGLDVSESAYRLAMLMDVQRQALEAGRPAAPGLTATAYQSLLQALSDAEARGVPLQKVLGTQRPVLDRLVGPAVAAPAQALAQLREASQALVVLRQAAIDQSSALLTEDPTLAALAQLSQRELPALHRNLALLRGLAGRQAALLAQSPLPDAELHRVLLDAAGRLADARRVLSTIEPALDRLRPLAGVESPSASEQVRAALDLASASMLALQPAPALERLRTQTADAVYAVTRLQQRFSVELTQRLLAQQADARMLRALIFGLLGSTLLLAAYLVYSFFLVMRGGLGKLNHQMHRMAQGDLSARPQARGGDEVADTLQALTASLARLSDLLASVRQGVGSITQAAEQIADGNADLSSRSRRSADGLQQLVASVARYSEQLQTCAQKVESVVTTVQALRLASVRNRRQVQRLQERMTSLRSNSREIGEIVNLIDTIAFRTNILALNAQVEASKAGEAGRGFAVVAQEVRALANRSADSARKVGEIVSRSTLEIEQGGALADETGQSIQEADAHVDAIHSAMSAVAELTQQGDRESAVILDEIKLLKETTTKNLDLVEQLAVASDGLRGQGERLSHKVGLFKLS